MAQANKRRYVFHFDINNTILMKDTAKGLSTTDNVSHYKMALTTLYFRSTALSARVRGVR